MAVMFHVMSTSLLFHAMNHDMKGKGLIYGIWQICAVVMAVVLATET